MDVVFLPATEPGDATYGIPPTALPAWPSLRIHQLLFDRQVWYNAAVRASALRQIDTLGAGPLVLVGFSKSGLGAWNLAPSLAGRVMATVIFDAPVARLRLPPWKTGDFYQGDADWQADLPILHIDCFKAGLPPSHRLLLMAGAHFHDEMVALSRALDDKAVAHTFCPAPLRPHHWQSGWIDEALSRLALA